MKTGISHWAFPEDMPANEALKLAKDIGFETFEVCVGDEGPLLCNAPEDEVKAIREQAKRLGIAITSVASGMGWKYPLSSPDAKIREKGQEAVVQSLQIAQWLGADAVLVVPGIVTEEVSYDVALENALGTLKELTPTAEKLQVTIAIENVWNKLLLSPVEMRDFIDQFESPYVGAYFDIGNILLYGYPDQWIRILGSRIRKIHAKDFRAPVGNLDGFVMLMEGDVNWTAVVTALNDIGYDGPLTAEYWPYKHSLEAMLRHCHASLEMIVKLAGR